MGSRRARKGQPVTRHLPHAVCVFHAEHGRLREGCQGEWEVGKGDPNETPKPCTESRMGHVVCAQESRAHQDED